MYKLGSVQGRKILEVGGDGVDNSYKGNGKGGLNGELGWGLREGRGKSEEEKVGKRLG